MNIEKDSYDSAKAQGTTKSVNLIESENPDSKQLLSKAKKRRLRKLKHPNSSVSSDSNAESVIGIGSVTVNVENSASKIPNNNKEMKPDFPKSKDCVGSEKVVSEKNNSVPKQSSISSSNKKKSNKPLSDSCYSETCIESNSQSNKKQKKATPKSNSSDDSTKSKKQSSDRGSEIVATGTANVSTTFELRSDKNTAFDGPCATVERLAIVERLFESPAFSHIMDRIQAESDTRQDRTIVGSSLSDESQSHVSSEPQESLQKPHTPNNMNSTKSRDEVMAEREAKKAAKAAAKAARSKPKPLASEQVSVGGPDVVNDGSKPRSAQPSAQITGGKTSTPAQDESVKSTVQPIHPQVISSDKRISDVVDGTALAFKPKFMHLISNEKIDQKQGLLSHSVEVSKSESSIKTTEKSKAELKAERRAKQEAQRAAKAAAKDDVGQSKKSDVAGEEKKQTKEQNTPKEKGDLSQESNMLSSDSQYMIKLFSHLRLNKEIIKEDYGNLHPAIIRLGIQYESRIICGSNARCVALLHAFRRMLSDYSTPSKQEFSRGLESVLARSMAYIDQCRPASVSMVNAVRHIKRHLTQIPITLSDLQAKQKLYDVIDTYVREQIDVAGEAISNTVQKKITNGDVILTYGCSSLVRRILTESHKSGTKFSVIVADGAPWFEGREMLRRLVKEGLHCSYVPISAASFVMREVSKVVVGAHALLANGCVVSRAGTSQVALLARSYNVAVLVCCETHKFSERVQTDAFVYNELGGDVREQKEKRLSLAYDVTPPDLVTAVVTELGILPCTSVPVILRIRPSESVV